MNYENYPAYPPIPEFNPDSRARYQAYPNPNYPNKNVLGGEDGEGGGQTRGRKGDGDRENVRTITSFIPSPAAAALWGPGPAEHINLELNEQLAFQPYPPFPSYPNPPNQYEEPPAYSAMLRNPGGNPG